VAVSTGRCGNYGSATAPGRTAGTSSAGPRHARHAGHKTTPRSPARITVRRATSHADPKAAATDGHRNLAAAYATTPATPRHTQDIVLTVRELGGYLSGVTLQADGDRRLADHALGIVATNPTPDASELAQHDRLRGTAAGYLPAATPAATSPEPRRRRQLGRLDPTPPAGRPPDESGSRPGRKVVNTGAFRRAERAGAYTAVRALDLDRTTRRGRPNNAQAGEPTRSRPRAHDRRGYWNFYRCGPRDNWHYEGRWIPPRRISADVDEVVPGRPIYHLPVPEGAAQAMGLQEPA
jgi:hypothetical protein